MGYVNSDEEKEKQDLQETLPSFPTFKRQTWKVSPVLSIISATREVEKEESGVCGQPVLRC